MLRQNRRTVMLGLAAASCDVALRSARLGSKPLFDGKSLDGWTPVGDANWTDYRRACSPRTRVGSASWCRKRLSYRDFDLRARSSGSAPRPTRGSLSAAGPGGGSPRPIPMRSISSTPGQTPPTAPALSSISPQVSPMPKAGGRWNLMEDPLPVAATFSVRFNGRKTVDAARDSRPRREGPIALQYGAGVVKFGRSRSGRSDGSLLMGIGLRRPVDGVVDQALLVRGRPIRSAPRSKTVR